MRHQRKGDVVRTPRRVSESGFYHVVARGNGRQVLFESDAHREKFVTLLGECMGREGVGIIAWCLMENHVHLVLEDEGQRLSEAMHLLLTRYAQYFNQLSGHVGHVFQERFFSEPVDGERYLLAAVRYVHLNPERAGICRASDYEWSSYREYVGEPFITRTSVVLDMVQGREGFVALCAEQDGPEFASSRRRGSEDEILRSASYVLERAMLGAPGDVKALPRERRNKAIRLLRRTGFSIRQIERLTGVGRGTVEYVTRGARAART